MSLPGWIMAMIVATLAMILPEMAIFEMRIDQGRSRSWRESGIFMDYAESVRDGRPLSFATESGIRSLGLGHIESDGAIYVFAVPKRPEDAARLANGGGFSRKRGSGMVDANGVAAELPEKVAEIVPEGAVMLKIRERR